MAEATKAQNPHFRKPLTQERLKALLHYDPETGIWTRIAATNNRRSKLVGKPTGCVDRSYAGKGRIKIGVGGKAYLSHRLAHFYMTGAWPPRGIDHKNRNPGVNRWDNLRPANQSQNMGNSSKHVDGSSRFKGVSYDKARKKWVAQISHQYKRRLMKRFDREEDAYAAYAEKALEIFGEFANVE